MLTFTGIGFLWNPKFVVESGLVALIGASMEVVCDYNFIVLVDSSFFFFLIS